MVQGDIHGDFKSLLGKISFFFEMGSSIGHVAIIFMQVIGCSCPLRNAVDKFVEEVFYPCIHPKLNLQKYAPEERIRHQNRDFGGLAQDQYGDAREWGSQGLITSTDFSAYLQASSKLFKALVLKVLIDVRRLLHYFLPCFLVSRSPSPSYLLLLRIALA